MSIYESNVSNVDRAEDSMHELSNQNENESFRKGKWSAEEDELLCTLVKQYDYKNWKKIAEQIKGRKAIQCLHRWSKILQPGLVKGPWTSKEDAKLIQWVEVNGPTKWSLCAETIEGRSGKQCREHWNNSLCPNVKKGMWSIEEDFLILFYYEKFKGSWKKISPFFEGRTENSIKNRFFSQLRKIAGNVINSNEKRATAKIKLVTLLDYIPKAGLISKQKLKTYLNLTNEEFDSYLQGLEDKLANKSSIKTFSDGVNERTKDGSVKAEINKDVDMINLNEKLGNEAYDLETLEREIYDQCDNSIFFHGHENEIDFENNLNYAINSAFQSKVEIINNINCTGCNNEPVVNDNKENSNNIDNDDNIQSYFYLMNELANLEKKVQETKAKLKQYEDNDRV